MSLSFPEYDVLFSTLPELIFIPGAIVTENTTPTVARGKGFTVSKNGTGVYRVTFNKQVGRLVVALPVYVGTAARILKKVAYDAANNYVEFRFENTSGAAAEPGGTDQLEFLIVGTRNKAAV